MKTFKLEEALLNFGTESLENAISTEVKSMFDLTNNDSRIMDLKKFLYLEINKEIIKQRNCNELEYFVLSYSFSSHNNQKLNKILNSCGFEKIKLNLNKKLFFSIEKNLDIELENLYKALNLSELEIPVDDFKKEIFKVMKNKISVYNKKTTTLNVLTIEEITLIISMLIMRFYHQPLRKPSNRIDKSILKMILAT